MNNSDKNLSVLQIEEELTKSKRLLVQALAEKESLLRGNELARFVPNKGGQVEFFAQALSYLRCVFSGNRFGKSTAGVVEDASWLLGFRPFYPEGHLLRYAGIPEDGVKGVVIASTWEKVEDIFVREGDPSVDDRVGKMFKYLPAANITSTARNQHGVISRINVSSVIKGRVRNSILCFNTVRSFLTNPLGQESSDWDFVHVDEPIPEEMWNAIARGLMDRGGKSWWLMTPLSEPWMFHAASNMEISSPDKCWTYIGDTDENITLSEENKENYFSTLSEDELACRKSGKPIALSRLVVSNFDRNKHVLRGTPIGWSSPLVPPKEFMICIATDTHPQTPHATLKVAVSPRGDIFVYGERFQKGAIKGPDSIAEYILNSPEISQLAYYLLEPGAWVEDQTTRRRYVDDFYEANLRPEKGSKKRTDIIVLFNALFKDRNRQVFVLEHCRVFLSEIERWHFGKDNKPKDENDHMMENFGRLLAHDNFTYHSPYETSAVTSPQTFRDLLDSSIYTDKLEIAVL